MTGEIVGYCDHCFYHGAGFIMAKAHMDKNGKYSCTVETQLKCGHNCRGVIQSWLGGRIYVGKISYIVPITPGRVIENEFVECKDPPFINREDQEL